MSQKNDEKDAIRKRIVGGGDKGKSKDTGWRQGRRGRYARGKAGERSWETGKRAGR